VLTLFTVVNFLQNDEAETSEVVATIMKNNNGWKVPERRVKKFIKRQRGCGTSYASSTDGMSTESSVSQSTRAMLASAGYTLKSAFGVRQVFSSKRTGEPQNEAMTAETVAETVVETGDATRERTSMPPETVTTSAQPLGFHMALSPIAPDVTNDTDIVVLDDIKRNSNGLFHDDNDGKREDGTCKPCEGCVIL